jgi:hypothetical protein
MLKTPLAIIYGGPKVVGFGLTDRQTETGFSKGIEMITILLRHIIKIRNAIGFFCLGIVTHMTWN